MVFKTEYEFTLPKGYLDAEGTLHREGTMRLATAADEILPLKDPRVQQNPAYLTMLVLSQVTMKLGTLSSITPKIIEGLFAADLAYLQALYQKINGDGTLAVKAVCPHCEHAFSVEVNSLGEV